MAKPFDATTKHLIEARPKDWLDYLGLPAQTVRVIDADVSTVTADADKVLMVDADPPYIAHFDLQAEYKPRDNERFMVYNVLLGYQHNVLVRTVIFLLRPAADGPLMREPLQRGFPDKLPYLHFEFRVVRVWEQSVQTFLQGGLGTLPLAPISAVEPGALPAVIRQMEQRIETEAPDDAGELWASTYILMGLRYPPQVAAQLLKGVRAMKESSTYQEIKNEGRAEGRTEGRAEGRSEGRAEGRFEGKTEEARGVLLRLGSKRFGEPDSRVQAYLNTVDQIETLDLLIDRILDVESWGELLSAV